MSTSIDEVVNLKDITYLWLTVLGVWILEYLSMHVSNHCLALFYVSLNVLLRVLSFRIAVAPQPLGFSVLIRLLSND